MKMGKVRRDVGASNAEEEEGENKGKLIDCRD